MSELELIERLAARGDGVTASGKHVSGAIPGDSIAPDGSIERGVHFVPAPCQHFGNCGGCQLQNGDEQVLADFVRNRVVNAAKGQGMDIGELLPEHLSPPDSRRRATFHGQKVQGRKNARAIIGFKQAGSHKIVDLHQCPVIHPQLSALIAPLRAFVTQHGPKGPVDIALTLCDQGVEVGFANFPLDGLGPTEGALDFARDNALARLSVDQGYGAETVWEPEPVTVSLSGIPVGLPPTAFLQATLDAEARMVADVVDWLEEARIVADLFAGLGTFAFGLVESRLAGRKVLAVEAERASHLACKAAGPRTGGAVLALHRDLFRNPLTAQELGKFGAVVLDPPRAGAKAQVEQIAQSDLSACAYVSCNPSSWARDAARLVEGGFRLEKLRPVGQFRWSTHVELVSLFRR